MENKDTAQERALERIKKEYFVEKTEPLSEKAKRSFSEEAEKALACSEDLYKQGLNTNEIANYITQAADHYPFHVYHNWATILLEEMKKGRNN